MKLLASFWELPMLWNIIIPLAVVFLFVAFLLWESRLPPEKKMSKKFRRHGHRHRHHHA